MKKGVVIFRIIAFLLVFMLLFICATEILKDKRIEGEYDVTAKVKGFYEEEKNSLDFVFVGSSQLYAHIAPNVLWHEYGMTSYDFAANEQPLWITYYYIKEALKYQSPQAIILDVFTVYGDEFCEEGVNHINLDDLRWGRNKIDAIKASVPRDMWSSFFFEIEKYHSTWITLDEAKFKGTFFQERNHYKGYSPFVFPREYAESAPREVKEVREYQEIPQMSKEWLTKIADLTRENGVDLILIKTPNGSPERQMLYNSVAAFAEEQQLPFLNMNTIMDGEAHVNILQAEKITKYVGEYLAANYSIEDKRKDPDYEIWNEETVFFYRQKAKCELISANTYEEYLPLIDDDSYVVILSMKSCSGTAYTAEQIAVLQNLGLKIDHESISNENYVAVLNGNKVATQIQSAEAISTEVEAAGLKVKLQSGDFGIGAESSISIKGKEYSQNIAGMNFLIYDKVLKEFIEMISFDTDNDMKLIRS